MQLNQIDNELESLLHVNKGGFSLEDFFLVKRNCLSRQECEEIMQKYQEIRHLSKKNKRVVSDVEKVINEVLLKGVGEYWDNVTQLLNTRVTPEVNNYLKKFKTVGAESYFLENVAFWEQRGMEYAPLHYDKEWIQGENGEDQYRNFLCLLYLNDDYENGEVIFPLQKKVIKPEAGMLLIFPTSLMFPHQTTPAIGNDRCLFRMTYLFDKETLSK